MSTAYFLVVAVFDNSSMAERAINDLKDTGFTNDEILHSDRQTKGGFFENLKSWVTGGEKASTDDIAKNLKDMGVSEDAANYYAREREAGHPVIAVRSPGHEQSARNILSRHGGHTHDMAPGGTTAGPMPSAAYEQPPQTTGYQPAEGYRQPDQPMPPQATTLESGEARIPIREEQLNVEKQRVQKGEVKIHKEVVTEQQTIDVPVSHEEVVIEQYPASEARTADTPISESETLRVPISEEQVNVTKETIETGEIRAKKRDIKDEKRVSGTIHREEPRIEKSGDVHFRKEDETPEQ